MIPDGDASNNISFSTRDSNSGSQCIVYTYTIRNNTLVFYFSEVGVVSYLYRRIYEFLLTNSVHRRAKSFQIYLTSDIFLPSSCNYYIDMECSLFADKCCIFLQCFRRAFEIISISKNRIKSLSFRLQK